MTTPKLQLPELVVGQSGKELTHNQALAILSQLTQANVVDKDLTAPPASPADGAMYIVAAGATGAWSGQSGKLAYWLTTVAAWTFITPADGWSVWVTDEAVRYERKAGAWVIVAAGGGGVSLPVVRVIAANETLSLANINTFGVNSTTSNYTSTIPAQATVAWTADAELHFLPSNTGDITITAAAGVSLNGIVAGSLTLSTKNGAASLKRIGADSWWLGGVIGTTAEARAALELTGDWVDLRPYLKSGYYFDSVRNGRNSYPRIRKLSCGRVELDGVVSFNETSGPTPIGVFVNVPAPFRPPLTAGGLLFADTASPLAFGACNWIVTGEVEYSPPRVHGDVMLIPMTLPATTQGGALSINGIYWFT